MPSERRKPLRSAGGGLRASTGSKPSGITCTRAGGKPPSVSTRFDHAEQVTISAVLLAGGSGRPSSPTVLAASVPANSPVANISTRPACGEVPARNG